MRRHDRSLPAALVLATAGDSRMLAPAGVASLHGGRTDNLEVHPNLWARPGLSIALTRAGSLAAVWLRMAGDTVDRSWRAQTKPVL